MFAAGPAIDANGQLTYTLSNNANGTATVSVSVRDSGGTANGGADTSPTQTFDIIIAPINDDAILDDSVPANGYTAFIEGAGPTIIDPGMLVPKPKNISFEEAATIPVTFITAYYSIHTLAQIKQGE